jgi:hypothetical protein
VDDGLILAVPVEVGFRGQEGDVGRRLERLVDVGLKRGWPSPGGLRGPGAGGQRPEGKRGGDSSKHSGLLSVMLTFYA